MAREPDADDETTRANRALARPRPEGRGRAHEPADEGFVVGLTRAPAAPQPGDESETERALARRVDERRSGPRKRDER